MLMHCKVKFFEILFKPHAAAASREVRKSRPNLNDLLNAYSGTCLTLLVITSVLQSI